MGGSSPSRGLQPSWFWAVQAPEGGGPLKIIFGWTPVSGYAHFASIRAGAPRGSRRVPPTVEGAGLGRPDRRVLGEDTPRAGERFRAMLACIQEHGQATTDVIDAEDVTDHDATDAHDQPEVTTCDEDGAGRPDERPAPIPPPHDGTGNTDPDDHEPTATTEAATLLDHDDQDPAS